MKSVLLGVMLLGVSFGSVASTVNHNSAFCAGYSYKMKQLYNTNYYSKMQQYFESKVDIEQEKTEKYNLMSEYYQSGSEVVKPSSKLSDNINLKCEELFKRKL